MDFCKGFRQARKQAGGWWLVAGGWKSVAIQAVLLKQSIEFT
jgi:hypothetical protein